MRRLFATTILGFLLCLSASAAMADWSDTLDRTADSVSGAVSDVGDAIDDANDSDLERALKNPLVWIIVGGVVIVGVVVIKKRG